MSNLLSNILTRLASSRFAEALNLAYPEGATDDSTATQAERWRDICGNGSASLPLSRNPDARLMIDASAVSGHAVGLSGWMWDFSDGSRLVANDQGVRVQ